MDSAPSLIGRAGGESGFEDVEMWIAISFGEPEDEAVAVEVAAEIIGVADIFLLALFDEGAEGSGLGGRSAECTGFRDLHLVDAVELVAALVVFEADAA
jgi:hypothetical protein